jgi:hypothetical protein
MFFGFLICLLCFLLCVIDLPFGGPFYKVVLFYLITGIFWVKYDSRRDAIHAIRMYANGPLYLRLFFILIWPFPWFLRISENIKRRRQPDRFAIDGDHEFATWPEAIAHALEEAKRLGQNVTVFDSAKFRYQKLSFYYGKKELSEAMYQISPDGKIRRCFSFWR